MPFEIYKLLFIFIISHKKKKLIDELMNTNNYSNKNNATCRMW